MAPLTTLLLPLVLLVNAARAAGPADIPAVLDSVPRVSTREFELYGPTEEEVRKANDELRVAISQFVNFLGENPRRMAFVLVRSAAEAGRIDPKPFARRNLPVTFWVLPGAAAPAGAPPAGAGSYPLGHAAGHRFLVAYVEHALAQAGASAAPGGAPSAPSDTTHASIASVPDWLEEAVAALCERPVLQKGRLDFMRAHLDARIPFTELLAMPRPAPARAGGAKSAKQGTGAQAAGVDRSVVFCDESLALARFIAHREEDRFVGTVLEGVLRGRTAADVLNTSQNLLSRPEALEKQWLEWMQGAERTP